MYKKGLSLVEVLVAISILVIIVGVSLGSFYALNQRSAINANVDIARSALSQARIKTLGGDDSSHWGVNFASSTVTIFKGSTYSVGASTNIKYDLNPRATISSMSISGGGSNIIFNRLTGETSNAGISTITFSSGNASTTITVYGTGIVE